jgi:hypothetical protein
MANVNAPKSFRLEKYDPAFVKEFDASASLASKNGDIVYLDSAGRIDDSASAVAAGVQIGAIRDADTGEIKTTASVGDKVTVCTDPKALLIGLISTHALADPYTTRNSGFDVAGSAGAQYIDATGTTYKTLRAISPASEEPDGRPSAVGEYAKVYCQFAPGAHFLNTPNA